MKKRLLSILLIVALVGSLALTGCGKKTGSQESTQPTESQSQAGGEIVLNQYFNSMTEGDCPVYGTWQLENVDYLSFIFRNNGVGVLAMGNEGTFADLTVDEKAQTLDASFLIGIQGKYKYTMSEDNNKMTLVPAEGPSSDETVLIRRKDYDYIPEQTDKNPVIDKDILGWWKGDNGQIYYFSEDGFMYSNTIIIETCYTYNAANGKIQAVYSYDDNVTVDMKYEYKDGKLILEENEYQPYDPYAE